MNITVKEFASMIDHSNLKAFSTEEDFRKLCAEAVEYGFKSVAVDSYPIPMCRRFLAGSDVLAGAAISFPLGQMSIDSKVAEARNAIDDGAQEFDYVCNVGRAKMHDWEYLEKEMTAMVEVARSAGICCKVIFENCYLTSEEIIELSRIASRVKPDFVKTSTGFGTGGAKPEDIRLMKQYAGPDVQVKAAGGIRTWEDAKAMIEAGATRIGCSAAIKIIGEMRALGIK